jgi:hypothetical protein
VPVGACSLLNLLESLELFHCCWIELVHGCWCERELLNVDIFYRVLVFLP